MGELTDENNSGTLYLCFHGISIVLLLVQASIDPAVHAPQQGCTHWDVVEKNTWMFLTSH